MLESVSLFSHIVACIQFYIALITIQILFVFFCLQRPYNFYVFPSSSRQARDVTLNPAAIQFLNDHGMDFAMWTKDGVGYLNTQQTNELIAKIETKLSNEEQQANNAACITNGTAISTTTPSGNNNHKKVVLTKTQDIQFVGRVTAAVREWLDNAVHHHHRHVPREDGQDSRHTSSFVLPPCNAFLRRALYETLGEAYPSLILEKGEGIHQKDCIVVHRLSEEEKKERVNEKKRKDIEELKMTIGFYRVFRGKQVVFFVAPFIYLLFIFFK
jgi:poly(A)-specific ribonuclease